MRISLIAWSAARVQIPLLPLLPPVLDPVVAAAEEEDDAAANEETG